MRVLFSGFVDVGEDDPFDRIEEIQSELENTVEFLGGGNVVIEINFNQEETKDDRK